MSEPYRAPAVYCAIDRGWMTPDEVRRRESIPTLVVRGVDVTPRPLVFAHCAYCGRVGVQFSTCEGCGAQVVSEEREFKMPAFPREKA